MNTNKPFLEWNEIKPWSRYMSYQALERKNKMRYSSAYIIYPKQSLNFTSFSQSENEVEHKEQ